MKHGRPPEEVAQLAEDLAATRKGGEPLSLWLEQRAQGLQEMVRAGWTWAQLAEALNRAGITYRAGVRLPFGGGTSRGAWTETHLPRAVQKARRRVLDREAARQALLRPDSRTSQPKAALEPVPEVAAHEPAAETEASPKVRVFGAEPSRTGEEPDTLERLQAEKVARAQSIIADWKKGR